MTTPPLYKHQEDDIQFILSRPYSFNTSDPGTGKTRTILEVISRDPKRRPALIICPKSIMEASWGADIRKFTPELTYLVATPQNRLGAIKSHADIVITNHDAVIALLKNGKSTLERFNYVVIDESTAYKNPESQRSKAIKALTAKVPHRTAMSGTPAPNTVLDLWHQLYLVDNGARLGARFYSFRSACCDSIQKNMGNLQFKQWVDKPGIQTVIAQQIADITIRRKLTDCLDIPEQQLIYYDYECNKAINDLYRTMKTDSILEISEDRFSIGVHAAAQATKLLQILSGAIYDNESYSLLDTERYDLVLDLIETRAHSLVAFNWKHQKHYLAEQAKKRKISFETIDGDTPYAKRIDIIESFQKGEFQTLFAHPQSTGHGLTLTKADTIIWASPTYNLEHYLQFNRRIYRAGQNKKTTIICIRAKDSIEHRVYGILNQKHEQQELLLDYLPCSIKN